MVGFSFVISLSDRRSSRHNHPRRLEHIRTASQWLAIQPRIHKNEFFDFRFFALEDFLCLDSRDEHSRIASPKFSSVAITTSIPQARHSIIDLRESSLLFNFAWVADRLILSKYFYLGAYLENLLLKEKSLSFTYSPHCQYSCSIEIRQCNR